MLFSVKPLLLLGVLAAVPPSARALTPDLECPGDTTIAMRQCAEAGRQHSETMLQRKLSEPEQQQWRAATQAACAAAYAPYAQGTIYPQLVVGCDDRLNRALLKEFKRMQEN